MDRSRKGQPNLLYWLSLENWTETYGFRDQKNEGSSGGPLPSFFGESTKLLEGRPVLLRRLNYEIKSVGRCTQTV